MNEMITSRLKIRPWKETDLKPFAQLNADFEVMRYFPKVLTEQESDRLAQRFQELIAQHGYGVWAVELLDTGGFIGCVGLNHVAVDNTIPENPFVEILWRFAKQHWGYGYATESARAVLDFVFNELKLDRIYAMTALINLPSQQLMKRIGMLDTGQIFNHPKVDEGHELQKHCLYKIDCHYNNKNKWLEQMNWD